MLVILTFGFGYWRCLFGLETSVLVNLVLRETDLIWIRLALQQYLTVYEVVRLISC